ncbi:MAG: MmgE/PrpD family protein [Chloroflexi bacterium]|nr:MmgE/PrpD family protein [Chloroflexota bacterium]
MSGVGPAQVERLAAFVQQISYSDISGEARQALKIRVLDSIACALGALDGPPIHMLRNYLREIGGNPLSSLIGSGGDKTSPEGAALYNSALVRYLDFNDSFLAKGETCHPSDNLGAVLAASEYAGVSGQQFLTALAVAYQVQCRLSEEAPVRAKGFDHTTQGAYAVAAGVSKALGLDAAKTANAISGTAYNALRVTRTGRLSNWKGLAYPNTAFDAVHATFLAKHGITGPIEVFEGNKGFMESVAGCFELDWSKEDLETVRRTILKKYNAEIHSQSVLEGILDLQAQHTFSPHEIECVRIEVFDVAYNIIGGGEEGDKRLVHTKEEADHSLPYMVAVAFLDGEVTPAQYLPERIVREDVQTLLRQVIVRPDPGFSKRFPAEMCCRIRVQLADGRELTVEKRDYEGFLTRPMSWEQLAIKLDHLATPYTDAATRREIVQMVSDLDTIQISVLTRLLARIGAGERPKNKGGSKS